VAHKALFDLYTNFEGTSLLAFLLFQFVVYMWAIRQSFVDSYHTFSFEAASKSSKRSVFGYDKHLTWATTFSVWWAQAWRMLLIPGAIIGGGMFSTLSRHPGAANYLHLLDNNLTRLNLYAAFVLSIWATKESLGDKYRTFRFIATPKTFYERNR
jgi:hypothetical protein